LKKMLLAVLAIAVLCVVPNAGATDSNFVGAFDFAQPSIVQWGGDEYAGLRKPRGGDEWLIVGMHISGCRVGRFRSCSLGFAWGSHYVGGGADGGNLGSGFSASLLVTSPQGIRLNPNNKEEPEWNLNVTPFYDATSRRFGFMMGFSVGG
jgi:hypothetical protein